MPARIGSTQAEFCTLLVLERMIFITKELEEDGLSSIGMMASSFQYSFRPENVFKRVSYLLTGIL